MKYIKTKVNFPQVVALTEFSYRIQTILASTVFVLNVFQFIWISYWFDYNRAG